MPFKIVRNDITKVAVDAVVNAANPMLKIGAGVCGAIFDAAGKDELQKECDNIGYCEVGQAVITKGYRLPAKYIIHTVGPIWKDGYHKEEELLKSAYINSMELAMENDCRTIAFPLLSSGHFGYPKEKALETAITAISEFLDEHDLSILLVVFDKASFKVSEKRLYEVEKFIDDNYIEEHHFDSRKYSRNDMEWVRREKKRTRPSLKEEKIAAESPFQISELYFKMQLEETFSQMLLRIIDERGLTDAQTYKRANITRQHFSKIRINVNYNPKKETAIALAIALMLNFDDTNKLLETAGLTLSKSIKFDVIIEYHIKRGIYDIHQINEMLFAYDQPCLGAINVA